MSSVGFTYFSKSFLFCVLSCASLLASELGDKNGGRAACSCCSLWASSYRSSSAGTTASVSSISSSAQIEIMRLLRHPRRPLRPPFAVRPRVLPGLLEQHDNVLHVSWEMGAERCQNGCENGGGKVPGDLSRGWTNGRKKLTCFFSTPTKPTQPRPQQQLQQHHRAARAR